MEFKETSFWLWWKEYGKHLEAFLIIMLLITVWVAYHNNSVELEETREICPCAFKYCFDEIPTGFGTGNLDSLPGVDNVSLVN